MPVAADYPFLDVLGTMLALFGFVIWMWFLFAIFGDLFRRRDISGWGKAIWTLLVLILPLIGPLAYLLTQGSGMAERDAAAEREAQARFEKSLRGVLDGKGPANEIAQAHALLQSGAIDQAEFDHLKEKALA